MWSGVTNDEVINSSFPSWRTSDDEDASGIGELGLFALQLSALVFISALGTFANALVFAVFYRRPSLRTISNRFVLSLILANLTSAAVMVPGHIYQLIARPRQPQPYLEFSALVQQLPDETDATVAPSIAVPSLLCSWCWHKQGLDGLTVLVALASVLSILLISLDRYYAVNSPLHYSIIVTRQKSMAMIGLVWIVAAILSTPVWAGSVVLQQYAPYPAESGGNLTGGPLPVLVADGEQQQYLMNLCYSVSLILFGFVWPLAALCWLYLRMYEAALKNSARTRRQSLCSNTNANATGEGGISAVAMAAAAAAAAAASNSEVPLDAAPPYPATHHNSLADALSSSTTAAAVAPETKSHTSARLLAAAAAAAAAAASSGQQRRRGNRYFLRMNEIQQHIFSILWREEGRALRTTAMVISSFTCCWLPFFVWLLPFQTSIAPGRHETRTVVAASTGVFLARLAAFSNVLISPAIYVYRNKVAQREAGRVLWLVFCPLSKRHRRHHAGQSNRYSHDIATPLVMGGLGVSGLTTPQLQGHGAETRRRANSSVLGSSRRSSQLTNNSLTDSPTRQASEDQTAGSRALAAAAGLAQNTVVNWRTGSIDCRLVAERTSAASLFQHHDDDPAPSATTPLVAGASGSRRLLSKPRASIAGGCCRPASSALASDVSRPETRPRSHTFSEARISASLSGSRLSPGQLPDAIFRPETLATFTVSSHPPAHDKGHAKRNKSPNSAAGAAAVAAAAIAAAELKAMSHPLAYPSLDFFDTGLEDYGRRGASSSFSRFIQPAAQVSQPNHQHSSSGCGAPASAGAPGRRRRTCSFSKVLSRSTKQTGANRWQTVFGSSKDQAKKTATSMPSVQHVPSLVTAV